MDDTKGNFVYNFRLLHECALSYFLTLSPGFSIQTRSCEMIAIFQSSSGFLFPFLVSAYELDSVWSSPCKAPQMKEG